MRNFRHWDVYKNSRTLVILVYRITEQFPDSEKFGLTSQMRRAGVSIVANIAEGAGRSTEKDFRHFLTMAIGSAFELEALIEVAKDLNFLPEEKKSEAFDQLLIIQKQLNSFISKLK
ncbi:MAG: four helix bundle protein [Algoriphagus sp.]|jgi:four helix bundle protein